MADDMVSMVGGLIARHALTGIAGALVADGVLQSNQTDQFVGAGLAVAGVAWSWWNKKGRAMLAVEIKQLRAKTASQSQALKATELAVKATALTAANTSAAKALALLISAAALFGWSSAHAADLPTKTHGSLVSPFVPNSAGGWYIGLGTSAGVANGSTSGSNLFVPSLVGGNLVADGASVDVVGGYIRNGGPLGTWWRLQAGASYQNISGGNLSGSINSRWRLSQEADIGADILQSIFSAVGNLGNLSSTFSSLNSFVPALPANVVVVGTPRQYVGVVLEESLIGGMAFGATGQSWVAAPGVKTGWIWELPGKDGKPNGNALEVNAQVTWPTQGVSFDNVLAAGGAPVVIGPAVKEGANYRAGIVYHFGL